MGMEGTSTGFPVLISIMFPVAGVDRSKDRLGIGILLSVDAAIRIHNSIIFIYYNTLTHICKALHHVCKR